MTPGPGGPDGQGVDADTGTVTEPIGATPPEILERETWQRFEAELAAALARMAPETYLIVTAKEGTRGEGRYVQFAHATTVFRAEASSNAYLHGETAITEDQEETLTALGWEAEAGDATARNFSKVWKEQPTPFGDVAMLATQSLVAAFDVTDPAELEFRYASFSGAPVDELPLSIPQEGGRTVVQHTPHERDVIGVRTMVEQTLKAWLHTEHLVVDTDGDWPIRLGSSMTFLRVADGLPPALQAFSVLVRDINATADLLSELNMINSRLRYVRVFAIDRAVVASLELPAVGLTPEAVVFACTELGNVADHLDDQLKGHFGGTLMFESSPKLLN